MDNRNHNDINVEDYSSENLLEFLNDSNTYFVNDYKSGIIGNKKTGVMIDARTGKEICDGGAKHKCGVSVEEESFIDKLKYDFLDYKKSIDILNTSDVLDENVHTEVSHNKEVSSNRAKVLDRNRIVLRRYLGDKIKTKSEKDKDTVKEITIDDIEKKINDYNNFDVSDNNEVLSESVEDSHLYDDNLHSENKVLGVDEALNTVSQEGDLDKEVPHNKEELISKSVDNDEELLNRINSRFNNMEAEISNSNNTNSSKETNEYTFYSFEDFEKQQMEEERRKKEEIEQEQVKEVNELDKFRSIMDFEDYLLIMQDDESILKSPFENKKYDAPKVVVNDNKEDDDSFNPFDTLFEVEEIENYDVYNNDLVEEGMLPELNLNQTISKKVSIREVIKNKQKKKQEQKELQEKMFFETLDDRIEQFKNYKESSVDSQGILNAINMDLNKINSSIKIEFNNLKGRKRKSIKGKSSKSSLANKGDKFSLQNLLEEIYEEKGEEPKSLDTNELDIDTIKKDLASKEKTKRIVN